MFVKLTLGLLIAATLSFGSAEARGLLFGGKAPAEPDETTVEVGAPEDAGTAEEAGMETDPGTDLGGMETDPGTDMGGMETGTDPDTEMDTAHCPPGMATVDIPEPHLRKLNVRKSPGGKVITTVPEGSEVTVVGECGFEHAAGFARGEQTGGLQWCQIDSPFPGCVLAKYLSFDGGTGGAEDDQTAGFKKRSTTGFKKRSKH